MICHKCGSNDNFLRKKGSATGLYCSICFGWIKWVSKKDLKELTKNGFKVLPELSTPNESSTPIGSTTRFSSESLPTNSNQGVEDSDDFDYSEYMEYEDVSLDVHPCVTCVTSSIDSLNPRDNVSFSILSGVLLCKSKDDSELIGAFKISYCPTCGAKLS